MSRLIVFGSAIVLGLAAWQGTSRGSQEDPVLAWIFFSDRGACTEEMQRDTVLEQFTPRGRDRRLRLNIPPDTLDCPVSREYLARLRQDAPSSTEILLTSRWLNAAVLYGKALTVENLNRLTAQPYISGYWLEQMTTAAGETSDFAGDCSDLEECLDIEDIEAELGIAGFRAHLEGVATEGEGVSVLILDTGFDVANPPCGAGVDTTINLLCGGEILNDKHGTHVWSLLARIAPKADYMLASAFWDLGICGLHQFTAKSSLFAVKALEDADAWGADIVSMSSQFGFDADSIGFSNSMKDGATLPISKQAQTAVVDRGLCVVVAAGNRDSVGSTMDTSICPPADAEDVISVGAFCSGEVRDRSGRGPNANNKTKPELIAYGEATSWATPQVAAMAVLLKQQDSTLTGLDIRKALISTASNAESPNNDMGWGLPNLLDAYLHLNP